MQDLGQGNTKAAIEKVLQVDQVIQSLANAQSNLDHTVGSLLKRLDCVLAQEPPQETLGEDRMTLVPLAESIQGYVDLIDMSITTLKRLEERLQI